MAITLHPSGARPLKILTDAHDPQALCEAPRTPLFLHTLVARSRTLFFCQSFCLHYFRVVTHSRPLPDQQNWQSLLLNLIF